MYEDDQAIDTFMALSGARDSIWVPKGLHRLSEAKAAEIGTKSTHGGREVVKTKDGWMPVSDAKGAAAKVAPQAGSKAAASQEKPSRAVAAATTTAKAIGAGVTAGVMASVFAGRGAERARRAAIGRENARVWEDALVGQYSAQVSMNPEKHDIEALSKKASSIASRLTKGKVTDVDLSDGMDEVPADMRDEVWRDLARDDPETGDTISRVTQHIEHKAEMSGSVFEDALKGIARFGPSMGITVGLAAAGAFAAYKIVKAIKAKRAAKQVTEAAGSSRGGTQGAAKKIAMKTSALIISQMKPVEVESAVKNPKSKAAKKMAGIVNGLVDKAVSRVGKKPIKESSLDEARSESIGWLPKVLNSIVNWGWQLKDFRKSGNTLIGYATGTKPFMVTVAWDPKAELLSLVVRARMRTGDKTEHKKILSRNWRGILSAADAASQVREAIRASYRGW